MDSNFFIEYKWPLILATATSLIGFVLVGIPGALVSGFFDICGNLLHGKPPFFPLRSEVDKAWSMAILYSVVIPWIVFICYMFLSKASLGFSNLAISAVSFLITFVIMFVGHYFFSYRPDYKYTLTQIAYENSPAGLQGKLLRPIDYLTTSDDELYIENLSHGETSGRSFDTDLQEALKDYRSNPTGYQLTPEQQAVLQEIDKTVAQIRSEPSLLTKENILHGNEWNALRTLCKKFVKISIKE